MDFDTLTGRVKRNESCIAPRRMRVFSLISPLLAFVAATTTAGTGLATPARPMTNPEMPAFWRTVRAHARRGELAPYAFHGAQHMLGSSGGLFRAFVVSGARPEAIRFHGKAHSDHAPVVRELQRDGFAVTGASRYATIDLAREDTRAIIRRLRADPAARVMVVDDGAATIARLIQAYAKGWITAEQARRIRAVEQTTAGLARIRELEAAGYAVPFAVVDVASSRAKAIFESPMIGRSAGKKILAVFDQLAADGVAHLDRRTNQLSVAISGLGRVGRSTGAYLARQGIDVLGIDPKLHDQPALRRLVTALGIRPVLASTPPRVDVDIFYAARALATLPRSQLPQAFASATGLPSTSVDLFTRGLADKSVVFNLASDRRDFNERTMRRWLNQIVPYNRFAGRRIRTASEEEFVNPFRRHRAMRFASGKEILFAHWGRVANFGGPDPIPPIYIQLTRGLLYLATIQAARLPDTIKGVVAIDRGAQRKLVEEVQRDLATAGLGDLRHPSF